MATSSRKFTARYYLLTSKATDETPSASPTSPIRSRASQTAATATPLPQGRIVKDRLSTNSGGRRGEGARAAGRVPAGVSFWVGHWGRPLVCVRACVARRRKIRFSVCGRGLPPPIGPEIHPNRPRKQGTTHERNNLAARSVLTWYSSSQYPNYAVGFRPCRTSTPVPVTNYRSYPSAFHSL